MAKAPPGGPGPSGWANRWAARMWRTANGSSRECIDHAAAGRASRTNDDFGGLDWRPTAARLSGHSAPARRDCGRRNWPFVRRPGQRLDWAGACSRYAHEGSHERVGDAAAKWRAPSSRTLKTRLEVGDWSADDGSCERSRCGRPRDPVCMRTKRHDNHHDRQTLGCEG
jgi:hypothetical protein